MRIVTLTPEHAPALMALTNASNWNHREEDWTRVLRLAGGDAWGMEAEGAIVATVTAVTYPGGCAWVGMVLTHPDWRGRGLARALMNHGLDQLDHTGTHCSKLDATDMGKPLYKNLGYEELYAVERWEGTAPVPGEASVDPLDLGRWLVLDREACGENRSTLLEDLASEDGAQVPGGYALARGGRNARFFGPCVARDRQSARTLACVLMSRHPGEKFFWDLIPGHTEAAQLARDLGFRPARRLVRMRRGCGSGWEPWPQRKVWGMAGFEYG